MVKEFTVKVIPVVAYRFKQSEGTVNIGSDKLFRACDRAINVTFSGEMVYCVDIASRENCIYDSLIPDICFLDEISAAATFFIYIIKTVWISSIGEHYQS